MRGVPQKKHRRNADNKDAGELQPIIFSLWRAIRLGKKLVCRAGDNQPRLPIAGRTRHELTSRLGIKLDIHPAVLTWTF